MNLCHYMSTPCIYLQIWIMIFIPLIYVSGKIGAFIALIPRVIVAALLCVIWSMSTAFGLSNLRYSETGSSRNVIIVGLSLFLSLSVPAYFQHYAAGFRPATVASYFLPYTVAAHGPLKIGIEGVRHNSTKLLFSPET